MRGLFTKNVTCMSFSQLSSSKGTRRVNSRYQTHFSQEKNHTHTITQGSTVAILAASELISFFKPSMFKLCAARSAGAERFIRAKTRRKSIVSTQDFLVCFYQQKVFFASLLALIPTGAKCQYSKTSGLSWPSATATGIYLPTGCGALLLVANIPTP